MNSKPVFLSVHSVGHKKPAGADPFTYRETRPLRYRASWWTAAHSSELYRGKVVATQEEAVRLARKWLAQQNKVGERWTDVTRHPERFGYAHNEKKTPKQLDADIAEALTKGSPK